MVHWTDVIFVCAREQLARGIRYGRQCLGRDEHVSPIGKMPGVYTFQSSNFFLANCDLLNQVLDTSFQPLFFFVRELNVGSPYFGALCVG